MDACQREVNNYWIGVGVSLFLTAAVLAIAAKQRFFANDPQKGAKFYGVTGIIKILMGIVLLTVLHPKDCAGGFQSFYGIIAVLLGIRWLARAYAFSRRETAAPVDSAEMAPSESSSQEIV